MIRLRITLVALAFSAQLLAFSLEMPSNPETRTLLESKFKGQTGESMLRHVRRLGNKTIEMEMFVSTDGEPDLVPRILGDFAHYGDWAMPGINRRPDGSEYYLKLNSLKIDPKDPSVLLAPLTFDLPLFKKDFLFALKMNCSVEDKVVTVTAETLPQADSPVKTLEAFGKAFPVPGRPDWLWVYLRGKVALNNWILYEALPEKMLERETGTRLQIVVDNYHREEPRRKAPPGVAKATGREKTSEK